MYAILLIIRMFGKCYHVYLKKCIYVMTICEWAGSLSTSNFVGFCGVRWLLWCSAQRTGLENQARLGSRVRILFMAPLWQSTPPNRATINNSDNHFAWILTLGTRLQTKNDLCQNELRLRLKWQHPSILSRKLRSINSLCKNMVRRGYNVKQIDQPWKYAI